MAESTMKPFEEDFEKYEVSTAGADALLKL